MSWVVLGASGFVGSEICRYLDVAGQEVVSLAAPRLLADPSVGVEELLRAVQVAPVAQLAAQLEGARVVVLAAGLATPDGPWSDRLVGANALLPVVVAAACEMVGVPRMVHLSSAAVQGRRAVLDESAETAPFSPYSRSKALAEQALQRRGGTRTEVVVVRATSVQGAGRPRTASLQRLARGPLASVAGQGSAPSPVSSVSGLADFVHQVGAWPGPLPPVVLQPWAGLSTADVLRLAGGREPRQLPSALCRVFLGVGWLVARAGGNRLEGPVRRVEAMWFGQGVGATWAGAAGVTVLDDVAEVLGQPAAQA